MAYASLYQTEIQDKLFTTKGPWFVEDSIKGVITYAIDIEYRSMPILIIQAVKKLVI